MGHRGIFGLGAGLILNGNAHRSRPPFGVHGSWVGRGERARLMQVCGVLRLVYRGTRTELSVYQLVTDLGPVNRNGH